MNNSKEQISVESIKQRIVHEEIIEKSLKTGSKLTPIRLLSEKWQISPTTVVKAIHELKNENILAAEARSAIVVKDLSKVNKYIGHEKLFAFFAPSLSGYYGTIANKLDEKLSHYGAILTAQPYGWRDLSVLDYVFRQTKVLNISGIYLVLRDKDLSTDLLSHKLDYFQTLNFPICLINSSRHGFASVSVENLEGIKLASKHLFEMGHRKIAYFTYKANRNQPGITSERNRFFLEEAKKLKMVHYELIEVDTERIIEICGHNIINAITKNGVSAFQCFDDELADWLIEFLKIKGYSIPEDISVIGENNIASPLLELTTIAHPIDEMAETMSRIILEPCKKNNKSFSVSPFLITRQTVGRISL